MKRKMPSGQQERWREEKTQQRRLGQQEGQQEGLLEEEKREFEQQAGQKEVRK